MDNGLYDKIYGSLIGAGIGDALGAPVEGWYWKEIREKYGRIEEFLPFETGYSDGSPGTFTDDSVLRHYLAVAIIERGGRILPDDWGRFWAERVNTDRLWVNESLAAIKLKQGMNPWFTGEGSIPCGCGAMMISPIGIVNAADPTQAFQDGMNIAGVNVHGRDQEAAASVAAATAAAFAPGATVDSIIQAMYEHSSWFMRRAYDFTMELARSSGSVDAFTERYYTAMLDWSWPQPDWNKDHFFSGNSHEFVPVVMALLFLCRGNPDRCIIEGASFGRDCDTIASILGGIVGALHGASSIRQTWIEQCERANRPFYNEVEGSPDATLSRVAERLVTVLRNEQAHANARGAQLEQLLSGRNVAHRPH